MFIIESIKKDEATGELKLLYKMVENIPFGEAQILWLKVKSLKHI